jgi:hypothetical protein
MFRKVFGAKPPLRARCVMQWRLSGSLLLGSLATAGTLRAMPALGVPRPVVGHLSEAASGAIFSLGLGLSGMLQPAKVAG